MSNDQSSRLRHLMLIIAFLSFTSSVHTARAESESSGSGSDNYESSYSNDWDGYGDSGDAISESAVDSECGATVEQSRC